MTFAEIQEIMEAEGWTFECISPLEIRHEDGSFASLNAADALMTTFNTSTELVDQLRTALRQAITAMEDHNGDPEVRACKFNNLFLFQLKKDLE